jgi:hypothetical protein
MVLSPMYGPGYGADMAVDLQTRLPEGFPNLGLLLFIFILLFHRRVLIRLTIAVYSIEASD